MGREGPRSFGLVLGQCEEGQLHADLSEKLQKLNENLGQYAAAFGSASGSISVTLNLKVDRKGTTTIHADVKVKEPTIARSPSIFWMNDSGNLDNKNPRQAELGFRDVNAKPEPPREVPAEKGAAQ